MSQCLDISCILVVFYIKKTNDANSSDRRKLAEVTTAEGRSVKKSGKGILNKIVWNDDR